MVDSPLSCWVVSDGKQGMENQCLGLAEAMGLQPVVKRVRLRTPWKELSPVFLRWGNAFANTTKSDPIQAPWPDVLIATGRQSVASSLTVGAASPSTFRIQIQDCGLRPDRFDLVVTPRHDRLRGANVLITRGSVGRVTPQVIAEAAERMGSRWAHLPRPLVAVLVGGTNGVFTMTEQVMTDLADKLAALCATTGAGLLVTTSRRTGASNEAILRHRLAGLPAYIWDGTGDNPYFAFLGLADAFVVTCDSVNMVCEPASTGKPIYVVDLPGHSRKFASFHQAMRDEGVTRPFDGRLDNWSYTPFTDTAEAAAVAWKLIREKRGL